jgi:hypothetical protein
MNRFAPLIRATSQRLDLPHPAKARLLVEMAADLQDVFEHCLARGASEDEAHAMACERFDLSDEALHRLVEVHASPVRRLLERLSERTRSRWERAMLVLLTAFVTLMTLEVTMISDFFLEASPLVWPVVALGVVALAIALTKIYTLLIKRDHDPRRARRGLPSLLGIAVLCPVLGCYTLVVELLLLAMAISDTPERAFTGVVMVMLRIAPVMITSLLVACGTAVLWFVLLRIVTRLEDTEARALVEAGAHEGGTP